MPVRNQKVQLLSVRAEKRKEKEQIILWEIIISQQTSLSEAYWIHVLISFFVKKCFKDTIGSPAPCRQPVLVIPTYFFSPPSHSTVKVHFSFPCHSLSVYSPVHAMFCSTSVCKLKLLLLHSPERSAVTSMISVLLFSIEVPKSSNSKRKSYQAPHQDQAVA